jgi:hypothetical protein
MTQCEKSSIPDEFSACWSALARRLESPTRRTAGGPPPGYNANTLTRSVMPQHSIEMAWPVKAAMDALNPAEMDRVQTVIRRLRDNTFWDLTDPADVRKLEDLTDLPGTYRVNVDNSIRLFFTMEPTRIVLQDMIRQEFADRFLK